MKYRVLIVAVAVSAVLTGCIPELIAWSPDGKRGLLQLCQVADSFRVCDAEGKLHGEPVSGLFPQWLPDSQHICWVSSQPAKTTWKQLAPSLPEGDKKRLVGLAESLCKRVLAGADWEAEVRLLLQAKAVTANEVDVMKLYLHDAHWDELAPKVEKLWGKLNSPRVCVLKKGRVDTDGHVKVLATLVRSLRTITSLRLSSDGKFVAYTVASLSKKRSSWFGFHYSTISREPVRLFVVATDGSVPPQEVAENVSLFPDWTPDGQSLVYAKSLGGGRGESDVQPGSIIRRRLRDADGNLLAQFEGSEELVALFVTNLTRIRCLRDGRIIFSSAEVALPAAIGDLEPRAQLFAVDPERQATVVRLIPRSAILASSSTDLFAVSPDQKRVVIHDTDEGRIDVLTLATGRVIQLQDEKLPKVNLMPSWHPNGDLCYLGSGEPPQVMLWSEEKGSRILLRLETKKMDEPAAK